MNDEEALRVLEKSLCACAARSAWVGRKGELRRAVRKADTMLLVLFMTATVGV